MNLGIQKTFPMNGEKTITLETGKLAKQADGSVVLKCGNTMLLATVVSSKEPNTGVDYLPLSVDYQEMYAATGRFPGGFLKREARPSDYEILIARLVDRAIRPLFPKNYHSDIQVNISLISGEKEILPDVFACLAASAALMVSDIPFNGPVSEVRVARVDGKLLINPSIEEQTKADLNLIVAATYENIMMVEGESKEVSEQDMIDALKVAHEAIKQQCTAQNELREAVGNVETREYQHEIEDEDIKKKLYDATYEKAYKVAALGLTNKTKRKEAFGAIVQEYIETIPEEEQNEEMLGLISGYYHDIEKEAVRNYVLNERKRLDGRSLDEIRPIWTEVDYLPSVHGSAIFTRGETQSLCTVTLGTKLDAQTIDGAVVEGSSKFILHYNFPGFSTGEVKMKRGVSRREIGHGNLAFRALKEVFPYDDELNPYTIRIVSDILESNGSSSMATVCAGSLALMDAGVKISKPVSGIAMGLIMDAETKKYAVLSDILGDEDHLGDMDFKVTGTKDGITACQMDIKVDGLPYEILAEALEQAKQGRLHILGKMQETIAEPRSDYKEHAPRIEKMVISSEFIGAIIGPGGKNIQELQKSTDTTIVIEEKDDKGIVEIISKNATSIQLAKEHIKGVITQPEIGEVYQAKVKKIMPYGAFVEFLPGKEGLLHISEIDWERLDTLEGVLKEGDPVKVKLLGIDKRSGKFKLSRKVLIPRKNSNESN